MSRLGYCIAGLCFVVSCGQVGEADDEARFRDGGDPPDGYPMCIGDTVVSCEDSWEFAGRCSQQPGCELQRTLIAGTVFRHCIGRATPCAEIDEEWICEKAHFCRWVRDACDAPRDVCDAATRLVAMLRGVEESEYVGCSSDATKERTALCVLANVHSEQPFGAEETRENCRVGFRTDILRTWITGAEKAEILSCGFSGFTAAHLASYAKRERPPPCATPDDTSDDCAVPLEHCRGPQEDCDYPAPRDGGFRDGGVVETVDAGGDAGVGRDGGVFVRDAGRRDSGVFVRDAGPRDGGVFVRDAGPRDGGVFVRDAGPRDGGVFVRDAG